ncbi:MAG: methyl-accepting chemotaxis protein [Campylobacterales bacterium]|nr:methyl-accepting chemotaxis protein [Campylobacterales bacterium]
MLKRLSINSRLILVNLIGVVGVLSVVLMSNHTVSVQSQLASAGKLVVDVRKDVLTLRKHEKDFLARKDLKYKVKFDKDTTKLLKDLSKLQNTLEANAINSKIVDDYKKVVKNYQSSFHKIVAVQQEIGLDHKSGLHGTLRSSIHKAETVFKEFNNYKLLKDMLMLRRNEKDFFQRLSIKYQDKFNKNFHVLVEDIDSSNLKLQDKKISKELAKLYKDDFLKIIKLYQVKGLDSKSGIHGEMRKTIHQTKTLYKQLSKKVNTAVEEKVDSLQNFLLIKALGIMVGITALIFFIGQSIIHPLKRLGVVANDLSTGDKDLTKRIAIDTEDELKTVVDDINSFIEKIQMTISEVKITSSENASVSEELSETSKTIGQRVEETSETIHNTTEHTVKMETMLRGYLEDAIETKEDIEKANENLFTAEKVIQDLVKNIAKSSEIEMEMAERLNNLTGDAEQVKGVLTVISDIAEQTNLLALNAAIEAARAGEHGRGFAVVADEVRKLAERTQKSLSEINATVNIIVQNVMDSSKQMGENANDIQGLVTSSEEAGKTILESKELIGKAFEMAEKSEDMAQTISTGIKQISNDIENVNNSSVSNTRSVEEIATASEHLSSLSSSLDHKLDIFKT